MLPSRAEFKVGIELLQDSCKLFSSETISSYFFSDLFDVVFALIITYSLLLTARLLCFPPLFGYLLSASCVTSVFSLFWFYSPRSTLLVFAVPITPVCCHFPASPHFDLISHSLLRSSSCFYAPYYSSLVFLSSASCYSPRCAPSCYSLLFLSHTKN